MADKRFGIYFLMLLVPMFWGSAFGITKHVLGELPPLTISAIRFLSAGLLMAAWAAWRGEWDAKPLRTNWLGLTILGASGVLGYNFFFATGMQYTSAINGALVIVINPVGTALISVLFLGERGSRRLLMGVLLSMAGVLTVITRGDWTALQKLSFNHGEILLLGAVASWILYTTLIKVVMRKVKPLMATTLSTLLGAVMLGMASLSESGWAKLAAVSLQTKFELVYLAIFPSFFAFLLFNLGVKEIGASKASAYINLMPVNAVLIAALFYGESVTAVQLAGMTLVMSGVLLTTRAPSTTIQPK